MAPSTPAPGLFDYQYYQDPYPAFEWLRNNAPMHEFRFPVGDVPMWIVSRYDDVRELMGDPRFSTDATAWASDEFKASGMVLGEGTVFEKTLTVLDPPDHTRVRKLAMSAFTPRKIAQWKSAIEGVVAGALDRLAAQEQPDLMDYAGQVAAEVMGAFLGFRLDRYEDTISAIERAFNPAPDSQDDVRQAYGEIEQYARELIEEKRRQPGEDLASTLITARDGGDRLSEDELASMIALMILAGLDTTRNLVGSASLGLLDFPDQRKLLAEQPELIDAAVEEFLRYDGAFTIALFRFAKEDLEFGGVRLPAGAPVVAALQSANRDERKYVDPNRLDFTRTGPRHLGLGHGLHNCLGSALARLETKIALPALFNRFPELELAIPRDEIHYTEDWISRTVITFPVRLGADRGN
ncbi:cytochrome P450 [Saccharothrix carnea]|uniref:Cytochrome P450 n=1 Tax=Saccharothrix carnea TaxID=1280637 RepID=A0A2P8HQY3_SACCR|nr:cytochrome P450 [Saccharothrix carnea]PSL48625.1 cytochrome P450 [Saccharothrix carnea]